MKTELSTLLLYGSGTLAVLAGLALVFFAFIDEPTALDEYPETQDDFTASLDRFGHITERMGR